jgi:HEAT repeat protein
VRISTTAGYDRAIGRFNDAIAMKGPHADAALYFKAWAQDRVGQRAEALTTIATLNKEYPKSRWLPQAKQLEALVRQNSGQPARPDDQTDDDTKMYALNGLMNADPEKAIPMVEKLLEGTSSPRVKSKALFVLAQNDSPRAREVLKKVAMGTSAPDLQNRAIDYLGTQGGRDSRALLGEIYGATNDVDVKRRILRAFMVSGERDRLLTAAQTEQSPELRAEAVQQLGVMGAHDALWQLYQKETSVDVKKRIIQAMFVGGAADRLIELAKTEKTPELRRTAIRNLGVMGLQEDRRRARRDLQH